MGRNSKYYGIRFDRRSQNFGIHMIANDRRRWFYPLQFSIYALGTAFSYNRNLCERANFTSKINKLQKLFNIWSQRDLSLYGRVFSAKTLGLLKLIYSSTCVQTAAQVSHIFNKLFVNFIWNGKKPKIKRDTLIGLKDKGSLGLTDYEIVTKSVQRKMG